VLIEGKAIQSAPARVRGVQRRLSTATRWPCNTLSLEAQMEARTLMLAEQHLSGERRPIMCSQDIVLGH